MLRRISLVLARNRTTNSPISSPHCSLYTESTTLLYFRPCPISFVCFTKELAINSCYSYVPPKMYVFRHYHLPNTLRTLRCLCHLAFDSQCVLYAFISCPCVLQEHSFLASINIPVSNLRGWHRLLN